jgi:UDP-N-acetylmuramoyl-tripeptide--D-alanyl-D-alanine ligase
VSGFSWNDAAVRSALGLRVDLAQAEVGYRGICTDSRNAGEGDLYVALEGERFDGHDFVAEAFARGAAGAVVSRPVTSDGAALYPVPDTLVALGDLAAHRRHALTAPVVGITGSVGKTTTKDLARGALSGALVVHATRANLNNRIGVPLTLLAVPTDAEVVVLEMGSNEPGEIATLAAIARPDIGVVTTVGEGHLEKLGSVEGVLSEKLDLLRGLAAGGRCVVGDEPDSLVEEARRVCPRLRVAGWSERADEGLRPEDVEVDHWGLHRFQWRGQAVALGLPGRHGVANALLALAVSELLGVPAKAAVKGLAAVTAEGMRGEVRRIGGLSVVVDCYNANPLSVRAALDLLESHRASRRVVVLGSMLELGTSAESLHRSVLEDALGRDIDLVVATGIFAEVASGEGSPAPDRLLLARDWEAAYPELRPRLSGDEVVLLKASRGVALEGILPLLESDFGGARDGDGA